MSKKWSFAIGLSLALFFGVGAYAVSPARQELGGTATSTIFSRGSLVYQATTSYAGTSIGTENQVLIVSSSLPAWSSNLNITSVTTTNLNVTNCVGCSQWNNDAQGINYLAGQVGVGIAAQADDIFAVKTNGTKLIFDAYDDASTSVFHIGNSGVVSMSTGIDSGYWNGTKIANNYGGTGQDSSGWTGFTKVTAGVWSTSSINSTIGYFVGFTTNTYDGKPTLGASTGYTAANGICNANFAGSHVCTFTELQMSNASGVAAMATNTTAWIANGPPGYLANSNDCIGFANNDPTGSYGAFWNFSLTTGGVGQVVSCANTKTFSCCK